ncbi:MAG: fatty acid desaturase [Pseudobdellovibrionaceae bacterium]
MSQNETHLSTAQKPWHQRIDWPVTLFLLITPLLALVLVPIYFVVEQVAWPLITFTLIFAAATNLSITAGYHRLFSHRSYEAHPLVRALYLLIGASAWQGSALKWSADHRRHHGKVDTDHDPYSINKGFWYAHMGWLFLKDSTDPDPKAPDLEKDWMVRIQHKYYIPIAIFMGFGFPAWVGYFMGCPFGALMIAGALRISLTQQSTFFVNSLCHTLGHKTYSEDVSARDSFIVALLTHGEGYHNFHHHFQLDYRNGIKWYQWDPTKWTIRILAFLGLAKKLKRMSQQEILKARLHMEALRIQSKGYSEEVTQQLREKILSAQAAMKKLREDYRTASADKLAQIKMEMELRKIEFRYSMKQWQAYLKGPQLGYN